MPPSPENKPVIGKSYAPDILQRIALGAMLFLTILTFVGANLHAILWQSSQWLVGTVLPAVVVQLTNEERAQLQEAPLRRNSTLDEAARLKAEHMARNEYFAHYAPDGTSPWYWFDEAGYTYAHAGENLAIHFTDSDEVVDAWMNSPKHRENIVNDNYTEIGVGTASGEFEGYKTVYVVQLFGTPAVPRVAPAPAPVVPPPAEAPEVTEAPVIANEEAVLAESDSPEMESETIIASTTPEVATTTASTTPESAVPAAVLAQLSEESVVIESSMIATSSGLAVATVYEEPGDSRSFPISSIATQPHTLLQYVYTLFGVLVIGLLIASVALEARRMRYLQMAYGCGLLVIMGGLWYLHALLTMGAVVV